MKNKWYSVKLLNLIKLILFVGIPFYYILPLIMLIPSVVMGNIVYINTNPVCLVSYDGSRLPTGAAGATMGYVVYISPDLFDDPLVHHHEYKHVEQYWGSLGIYKIYYIWSKKHRLLYEYEAYLESLKYSNDLDRDLPAAAMSLANKGYGLNITPELAFLLLQNGINKHRGIE